MATVVTMASSSSSTGADASTACAGSLDSIRKTKGYFDAKITH